MGWWELKIYNKFGDEINIKDLDNDDVGRIMNYIRQRYSDGDLIHF
jgi:hypothetical protein